MKRVELIDETTIKIGDQVIEIGVCANSIVAVINGQIIESWEFWPEDWSTEVENMKRYLIEKYAS